LKKHGREFFSGEARQQNETDMRTLITIKEVCRMVKCSPSTVYSRSKTKGFPKPKKIPAVSKHGPRTVNRWDHSEVTKWLSKNGPAATKKPAKKTRAKPRVKAKPQVKAQPKAQKAEAPAKKDNKLVITAVAGGLLAGIAVYLFG
jgi:predicted DNA-binding transcriptional regulator AlpA